SIPCTWPAEEYLRMASALLGTKMEGAAARPLPPILPAVTPLQLAPAAPLLPGTWAAPAASVLPLALPVPAITIQPAANDESFLTRLAGRVFGARQASRPASYEHTSALESLHEVHGLLSDGHHQKALDRIDD